MSHSILTEIKSTLSSYSDTDVKKMAKYILESSSIKELRNIVSQTLTATTANMDDSMDVELPVISDAPVVFKTYFPTANPVIKQKILNAFTEGFGFTENTVSISATDVYIYSDDTTTIQSMLTVAERATHIEIYDVCTVPKYRGHGYATKLLEFVLNAFAHLPIYLCVMYRSVPSFGVQVNPDFGRLVKFYSKLGFAFPVITNSRPTNSGNNTPFPFLSVSLWKYPGSPPLSQPAINKTIEYTRRFGVWDTPFKAVAKIAISDLIKIHMETIVSNADNEFGGAFVIDSREIVDDMVMYGISLKPNAKMPIVKNVSRHITVDNELQPSFDFTSTMNPYYFTWHTHPNVNNLIAVCYTTSPSALDYGAIVSYYRTHKTANVHFVFTVEGVYGLSLSIDGMKLFASSSDQLIAKVSAALSKFHTHYFDAISCAPARQTQCVKDVYSRYKLVNDSIWSIIKTKRAEPINNKMYPNVFNELIGKIADCIRNTTEGRAETLRIQKEYIETYNKLTLKKVEEFINAQGITVDETFTAEEQAELKPFFNTPIYNVRLQDWEYCYQHPTESLAFEFNHIFEPTIGGAFPYPVFAEDIDQLTVSPMALDPTKYTYI